ncbi:uncharacterized protein LOC143569950 [Bidens hawaiensis]|uniref:uncharacterized protein LOC143569950 n=1 Tax=Bidens hawaiensis TaxID=980011 RepID=UPI00404916E4
MSQASTSSGPGPGPGPGPAVPTIPENHSISIPPPPSRPTPKLPCLDLLQGTSREEYINVGIPLYEAALKGDWKAAEPILKNRLELVGFAITENHETLLHIAASAKSTKAVEFVKHLVEFMKRDDLEVQNKSYDTALSLAAEAGNTEIAKIMLEKNSGLIEIPNKQGLMPLYMAALFAHPEMVRHLYDISKKMAGDFWTVTNRGWVLQKCVESEIFDVAIKIVNDIPNVLEIKVVVRDILLALAGKTKAFEGEKPNVVFRVIKSFFAVLRLKENKEKESEALQLLKIIWGKAAKLSKKDIDDILRGSLVVIKKENKEKECEALPYLRKILEKMDTELKIEIEKENQVQTRNTADTYPSRVLFVAAKKGNIYFITELIRLYPDAIWKIDDKGKTIFHLAIKRRHAKIYNLLYEIGAMKDLITSIKDISGNNMLHMVSKSGKQARFEEVSGVALQMQRELLWFKEVEHMIPPQYRERKNNVGETPRELFTKKHADLVTKGEQWMKDTASQCMVVATLIATIVFAAAFTLPGGYIQGTGIPFFRKEPALIIFVISDAISLISSSTSILIFLSILTSRYAENDFLASLPNKLMFGIATLLLSIVTMMIAFSASFFVLDDKIVKWVPITITSLAAMPVILFAILQFRGIFITQHMDLDISLGPRNASFTSKTFVAFFPTFMYFFIHVCIVLCLDMLYFVL